ncbi:hypothetical protein ACWIGI_34490 [Nocardia sp. NPDC055321]
MYEPRRLGVLRPNPALIREVPVRLYVFDLLSWHGRDLRELTYTQRREQLSRLALPAGGPIAGRPIPRHPTPATSYRGQNYPPCPGPNPVAVKWSAMPD